MPDGAEKQRWRWMSSVRPVRNDPVPSTKGGDGINELAADILRLNPAQMSADTAARATSTTRLTSRNWATQSIGNQIIASLPPAPERGGRGTVGRLAKAAHRAILMAWCWC